MAEFPFTDLHSFKDYVVFVQVCSPNLYPRREGVSSDEQWTLQLAFEGLRVGMDMAVKEKGERPGFAACRRLFDEAYAAYSEGRPKEGYDKMETAIKFLKKTPTH